MPVRPPPGLPPPDVAQLAAYLMAMADELAELARKGQMPFLGYIFDMARIEAEAHAAPGNARPPDQS